MKKFLFLTLVFTALVSATTYAQKTETKAAGTQAASDQAAMLQKMKDIQVPLMVEKTGFTKEQANKIVEINFETRMAAAGLQNLSEADRTAKLQELKDQKAKKFAEFLTPEQIETMKTFYQEYGKQMAPKPNN